MFHDPEDAMQLARWRLDHCVLCFVEKGAVDGAPILITWWWCWDE